MRRLPAQLIAVLGLGVLLLLLAPVRPENRRALARIGRMPLEMVHRISAHAARGVLAVQCATVATAWAQDTLSWKPVGPGAGSLLERRRGRRVVVQVPEPPAVSDTPEPPAADEPVPPSEPSRPELLVSKSGSITRIGSDVHVERDQVVAGDLVALGGDVTVDGHVEGDLVAMGGDVRLSATARVDGDVATIGGRLTEEPGAVVGGQRVSAAGGMRGLKHLPDRGEGDSSSDHGDGHVAGSLIWMMIMMLLAWGFTSVAPGRTAAAVATLRREPALSFGIGMLIWALVVPSMVALSLVIAILCITLIGIPLAIAALFGYFLFIGLVGVWGFVVAMAAVGGAFTKRTGFGGTPVVAGSEPSLTRSALTGVLLVAGAGLLGELMKSVSGPLHGLGSFLAVMSILALCFATTFGAGAWLRNEIVSDTLGRWWRGRRRPSESTAPPSPPASTGLAPDPANVPPVADDPTRWKPPTPGTSPTG